jgi:uncharacterized protein
VDEPILSTCKIVITGPFSSGKTRFIKAISEIDVVSTEKSFSWVSKKSKVKENVFVALDFGRITSSDGTLTLYLFGTPGALRVTSIWETLSEGIMGCVFMIDSSRPETFREARAILDTLVEFGSLPIVIAANKQDLPDAWNVDALRIALHISEDIPIIPCVATDRESVKGVMIALLNEVLKDVEGQSE